MKVKCINDNSWTRWTRWTRWLTLGKIYDVIEIDSANDYWVINDNGYKFYYPKEWFKPLSEIRNERIDKLLKNES